jgi:hypothetical protein
MYIVTPAEMLFHHAFRSLCLVLYMCLARVRRERSCSAYVRRSDGTREGGASQVGIRALVLTTSCTVRAAD